MENDKPQESPFACDMGAIEPGQRAPHMATMDALFRAVVGVRELPNGYAFQLPNESDVLLRTAEFVALERLCCPFFGFTLGVEPEGGAVWLSMTGREGVKPFILAEIGSHLGESVVVPQGPPAARVRYVPEDYRRRHLPQRGGQPLHPIQLCKSPGSFSAATTASLHALQQAGALKERLFADIFAATSSITRVIWVFATARSEQTLTRSDS